MDFHYAVFKKITGHILTC